MAEGHETKRDAVISSPYAILHSMHLGPCPISPYTLPNATCAVAVAQPAGGLQKKEEQSA